MDKSNDEYEKKIKGGGRLTIFNITH